MIVDLKPLFQHEECFYICSLYVYIKYIYIFSSMYAHIYIVTRTHICMCIYIYTLYRETEGSFPIASNLFYFFVGLPRLGMLGAAIALVSSPILQLECCTAPSYCFLEAWQSRVPPEAPLKKDAMVFWLVVWNILYFP
jgi:hypothetical protein